MSSIFNDNLVCTRAFAAMWPLQRWPYLCSLAYVWAVPSPARPTAFVAIFPKLRPKVLSDVASRTGVDDFKCYENRRAPCRRSSKASRSLLMGSGRAHGKRGGELGKNISTQQESGRGDTDGAGEQPTAREEDKPPSKRSSSSSSSSSVGVAIVGRTTMPLPGSSTSRGSSTEDPPLRTSAAEITSSRSSRKREPQQESGERWTTSTNSIDQGGKAVAQPRSSVWRWIQPPWTKDKTTKDTRTGEEAGRSLPAGASAGAGAGASAGASAGTVKPSAGLSAISDERAGSRPRDAGQGRKDSASFSSTSVKTKRRLDLRDVAAVANSDADDSKREEKSKERPSTAGALLSTISSIGWPWSTGIPQTDEEKATPPQRQQSPAGGETATPGFTMPSFLPFLPASPEGVETSSWFPTWGGGNGEGEKGEAVPAIATPRGTNSGSASQGPGSDAGASPAVIGQPRSPLTSAAAAAAAAAIAPKSDPVISTDDADGVSLLEASRHKRGLLPRVKSALGRPLAFVGMPFRGARPSGPPPPKLFALPPAARGLQEMRSEKHLSFPVRTPWRPPGYRWGATLWSKRRSAMSGSDSSQLSTIESAVERDTVGFPPPVSSKGRDGREKDAVAVAPIPKGEVSEAGRRRDLLAGAKGVIASRLRPGSPSDTIENSDDQGTAVATTAAQPTDEPPVGTGEWSRVELVKAPDANDDEARDDMAWWQFGAAVAVGMGAALYRPMASRIPGLGVAEDGEVSSTPPSQGDDTGEEASGPTSPLPPLRDTADTSSEAPPNVALAAAGEEFIPSPPVPEMAVVGEEASPADRRKRFGFSAAWEKVATTSRRAQLWLLLRRNSMARAKPLLPGVETGISALLSVPRKEATSQTEPSESLEMDAGKEAKLSRASTATDKLGSEGSEVSGTTALDPSMTAASAAEVANSAGATVPDKNAGDLGGVPQAVGGGGWNLFGFFPKDKEQEEQQQQQQQRQQRQQQQSKEKKQTEGVRSSRQDVPLSTPQTTASEAVRPATSSMAATGSAAAARDDTIASVTEAEAMAAAVSGKAADATAEPGIPADAEGVRREEGEAVSWPRSAWVEGLDPRAQVESAMRDALRSAFGYTSTPGGTEELPAETLAAAAAAAGDAAVQEGSKRYLDERDGRWLGAEAAAAAAGAAAGAAMGAAGVAAGVAADVAAAATAATFKVAAPFGRREDSAEDAWRAGGSWAGMMNKDDQEFGRGDLGVRPRKLDPVKAMDVVVNPVASSSLKRSVASDKRFQRQVPRGARILSAAVQRSRLPQRWKSKAAAAAAAPVREMDMQDMTLRRLGRVGIVEIASSMLLIAAETAQQVDSVEELEQFRKEGGMPRLLMALSPTPYTTKANGLKAIRNLLRVCPESVASDILQEGGTEALLELRRLVGAPGEPWSSAAARAAAAASDSLDAMRLQAEAVQLLQELSLASEQALAIVRYLPNLIPALSAIAYPGTGPLGILRDRIGRSLGGVGGMVAGGGGGGGDRGEVLRRAQANSVAAAATSGASKLLSMLGVHNWRPRQPGQKGLRILSLDGGGTRGVLTIAILREVLKGFDKDVHEVFDVICGTSTGGILAMLFASEKQSLATASAMYDSLIVKIFKKDLLANAKLVLLQAQYSSTDWEAILEEILGQRRMIDMMTNPDNPKVVVCSTIMNVSPLEMMLWRNYGYRPDQEPVYKGDYRRLMRECVRASTAAPPYFTPLIDGQMMYADGAFKANNPTSIAVTEAKLLFPDVPIECVLSVGTGYYIPKPSNAGMSWNTVINQLVNSATDTEGIDSMLKTFLPRNQYFRFNPSIEPFDIDEIRPERLNELKIIAKEYVARPEVKARAEELRRILLGEGNSAWSSDGVGREGTGDRRQVLSSQPTPVSPFSRGNVGDAR